MSGEPRGASSLWTRRSLVEGSILSATCFVVAIGLELLGRPAGAPGFDPGAVLASVLRLEPAGWAALGAVIVIATPALSLAATALEFRRAGDRSAVIATIGVLAILGLSVGLATAR